MHISIHMLFHFIRHSRLMGWNMRFFGTMLLMLVLGMLQLVTTAPAFAMVGAKDSPRCSISTFSGYSIISPIAPGAAFCGLDRADHRLSFALNANGHAGVYSRLKPRIVMIPRMNRVPKPKSVYRLFARAPGSNSLEVE
jgi:hypothetical protein